MSPAAQRRQAPRLASPASSPPVAPASGAPTSTCEACGWRWTTDGAAVCPACKRREAEADFLRKHYAERGQPWCAEQLGLTPRQVQRRTRALGLRRRELWTPKDRDMLIFQWGPKGIKEIAGHIGRTPRAAYDRAGKLGLGRGCPRGYVYLSHLARETGYSRCTMRMILAWAGVGVSRGPKNPQREGRKHLTWIVDHGLGLEAVDRWLEAESVNHAAKRFCMHSETLKRWLVQDGRAGSPPAHQMRWMVPTSLVDAVVAARRSA